MIKITNTSELHAVLAKLEQEGATWGRDYRPQWLEDVLTEELTRGEIIIDWVWAQRFDKEPIMYKSLYWIRPTSAEEYLNENEN